MVYRGEVLCVCSRFVSYDHRSVFALVLIKLIYSVIFFFLFHSFTGQKIKRIALSQ